jgi:hypothetical protein
MIESTLVLGLLLLASVGWGRMAWRGITWFCQLESASLQFAGNGLLGLLTLGLCAMVINFFSPLYGWISTCLLAVGVLAALLPLFRATGPDWKAGAAHMAPLVILLPFFAWWSGQFGWSYDSGLYHLQTIAWMREEPVALGLANLHPRLAYNSAWLAAVSVFSLPGAGMAALHLSSSLFVILSLSMLLCAPMDALRNDDWRLSTVFALFALLALTATLWLHGAPLDADLPASLLTVIAFFQFLKVPDSNSGNLQSKNELVLLWLICLFAVLCKLTAAPVMLLAMVATYRSVRDGLPARQMARCALLLGGVGLIWALRNTLLSGCLAFPAAATCFSSLPWGVDAGAVEEHVRVIREWARIHALTDNHSALLGWDWLNSWTTHQWRGAWLLNRVQAMVIPVLGLALLWRLAHRGSPLRGQLRGQVQLELIEPDPLTDPLTPAFAVGLLAIALWFASAPDPRWAWGFLTALIALAACWLIQPVALTLDASHPWRGRWLALSVALVSLVSLVMNFEHSRYVFSHELSDATNRQWRRAILDSGNLYLPGEGDQCWQAPLPCTPELRDGLQWRRAGGYLLFSIDPLPGDPPD